MLTEDILLVHHLKLIKWNYPLIEISLIIWRNPIIKKYTFANLENYSNKFIGRNVITVYLDVDILLLFFFAFNLPISAYIISKDLIYNSYYYKS